MKSSYAEYENWGTSLADLPPRSQLFSLIPVGIGTEQAECLTSYLKRLAAAHCLSAGTFYRQVVYPAVRADAEKRGLTERPYPVTMGGITKVAHSLNGVSSNASNHVRALERLTCVPRLHLLTWLPWEAALSCQSLLRQQRALCPMCIDQWRDEGQTIYEPLLWTLQVVKVCPIHHCLLVEVCPCCQREIELLSNKARAGHCSHCRQRLDYTTENQLPVQCRAENDQLEEQLGVARSAGELIAKAPELPGLFSRTLVRENLRGLINRLGGNAKAFAEFIGCQHNAVFLWREGRCIPRLELILKLCHRLHLPVADFLTVPIDKQIVQSEVKELFDQHLGTRDRRKREVREVQVRQALEAALLEEPPPPLIQVARRLGYLWTDTLYGKYGELCRKIIARSQNSVGHRRAIPPPPDEQTKYRMRRLLEQELREEYPQKPSSLAAEAGYQSASIAYREFPQLWRAVISKRREYKAKQRREPLEREREAMAAALREEPTPTMKEIIRRLGYNSGERLYWYFPDECRAIREQRARQRKDRLEKLEASLRTALSEEPPRTLKDVAASLGYSCQTLYERWSELCCAITARYTAYQKEDVLKRRLALRERIRQIAFELHQRGIYPSESRIRPLICNVRGFNFVTLNQILKEIRQELGLPALKN